MRLYYLAFSRIPTEKAHGAQIMKTCEALAGEGAEVELVIPGRKTPISEGPFSYYGVTKNFTITNLHTPDWVRWGAPGFVLSVLWFSEAAKWRKDFWSADIIYSRDAFILLQYLLLRRKLVYEAHTKPTSVSTFVAKRAYKVVVISEGLRDAYLKRGVSAENVVVAHDAIDPAPFKKQYDQKESRVWLGIPEGKYIALYVGRIDAPKGADTFAAASEYVPENIQCVLVGSGPLTEDLKRKYPKALFLPETPYRELPRVLAAADVLVLPNSSKDEDAALYTSPLKAFAYAASEKPIIASDVPALTHLLEGNVSFFAADDSRILANTLHKPVSVLKKHHLHTWGDRAKHILASISNGVSNTV